MTRPKKLGVALLYSVLLITVILSIGLLLMDIITKQIILSSVGKNSQFAYYASNIGLECARYWATGPHAFGDIIRDEKTGDATYVEPPNPPQISCAEHDLSPVASVYGAGQKFDFTLDLTDSQSGMKTCAIVTLFVDPDSSGDELCRVNIDGTLGECSPAGVISQGYNTGCDPTELKGPRAVEREVRTLFSI